jgi:hypothetical protein
MTRELLKVLGQEEKPRL